MAPHSNGMDKKSIKDSSEVVMEILTIDELIASILQETEGLDAEITEGMILKKQAIPYSALEALKLSLGLEALDQTFIDLILSYNWGNVGFLSYQFGYGDEVSLRWLINRNLDYEDYPTLHQLGLIIIANGDPYTLLLECTSGQIYALTSELDYDEKILIASDFGILVRAMGTGQLALWQNEEKVFISLMAQLALPESLIFWKSLVGYYG